MNESTQHNGFKLIGIIPLKDCDQKFRKNLNIGTPYLFYNNYKVKLNDENSSLNSVTVDKSSLPLTIYNLENGIKINVSAVVGANGSGKSALIELFYYFVYSISSLGTNNSVMLKTNSSQTKANLEELINDISELINKISTLDAEFVKKNNDNFILSNQVDLFRFAINTQNKHDLEIYLNSNESSFIENIFDALLDKIKIAIENYDQATKIDTLIFGNLATKQKGVLNVAVLFESGDDFYNLEFFEGKLKAFKNNEYINDFDFRNFFYTISLNYSHHSLNSNVLGGWIDTLFHKNDGYRTPVVINPMRDEGVYDINSELNLSKERLMFNLAYYLIESQNSSKKYKLLGKYIIKTINVSIKPSSYNYPMDYSYTKLRQLNCYFLIEDFINENNAVEINHLDIAVGYLQRKLSKIKRNYSSIIFKDIDENNPDAQEDHFQNFISEDNSHITKKIKQVVNYLKFVARSKNASSVFNLNEVEVVSLSSDDFIDFIKKNKAQSESMEANSLSVLDLMNFLLPSIFNIDFNLSLDDSSSSIMLSQLSSGEQQMIFNVNTVLYHIYNLQSSFLSQNNRLVYKNINVILDEIELYYHPDMQRETIKNILDSLELVNNFEIKTVGQLYKEELGIESINICFLTHSSFVLSDIPSQNILKLKEGVPQVNKKSHNSFAANIHDLLADEFFLENGNIGAFATQQIEIAINLLNYIRIERELDSSKKKYYHENLLAHKSKLFELGYWNEKKFDTRDIESEKKMLINLIEIIGEPIIKHKLSQMYQVAFNEEIDRKKEDVEAEIKQLAKEYKIDLKKIL